MAYRGVRRSPYQQNRWHHQKRRRGQRRGQQRGFRFLGPFPGYSTTTRRGSRVHVGGCCLPIPLTVLAGTAGFLSVAWRRRAR